MELNKLQNSPELCALFFNRRHLIPYGTISFLLTTQKYIACPTKIRSVLTGVYFFNINKNDMTQIMKEFIYRDRNNIVGVFNKFLVNPHDFIYINLDSMRFYINFDEIV